MKTPATPDKHWIRLTYQKISGTPLNEVAAFLLIALFTYASMTKLLDFEESRRQMLGQPFPEAVAEILSWLIPVLELGISGSLIFPASQIYGFRLSAALLITFSLYILLVLLGFWGEVPCSCGGLISDLNWGAHLTFNLFFIIVSLTGWYSIERKGGLVQ